eukprot:1369576-Amorphochlora_amoeboformis.AAC.1
MALRGRRECRRRIKCSGGALRLVSGGPQGPRWAGRTLGARMRGKGRQGGGAGCSRLWER